MGKHYSSLNLEERSFIQLSLEFRKSLPVIGRSINRSPSTISRELARSAC